MEAVESIIPGIRRVTPPQKPGSAWQAPNLYLVGDDQLTLIDSGYDREDDVAIVLAAIGGAALQRIILTHGHVDHAGGAWRLRDQTGAPVLAHPADMPSIERRFPGRRIDRPITEGARIIAGPVTLDVILAPGHSPGHVILHDASRRILFTSDLITGDGSSLVAPPEGNMAAYMRSLHSVQAMTLDLILPGHGPIVHDPAKRVHDLIEHRELREICIVKCLAEAPDPLNLSDLVKAMYLGLIHPHLIGPAAATAWAHLEKLIAQGAVIAEPRAESNPFNKKFALTPRAAGEVKKQFP
ncbi:MAG TPA: MBL fold metallo-hydrolase [bacterium]|nr:MBL fold metallo-hydrolase [bacterium]